MAEERRKIDAERQRLADETGLFLLFSYYYLFKMQFQNISCSMQLVWLMNENDW